LPSFDEPQPQARANAQLSTMGKHGLISVMASS
jgi:hypothetical protein